MLMTGLRCIGCKFRAVVGAWDFDQKKFVHQSFSFDFDLPWRPFQRIVIFNKFKAISRHVDHVRFTSGFHSTCRIHSITKQSVLRLLGSYHSTNYSSFEQLRDFLRGGGGPRPGLGKQCVVRKKLAGISCFFPLKWACHANGPLSCRYLPDLARPNLVCVPRSSIAVRHLHNNTLTPTHKHTHDRYLSLQDITSISRYK